MCDPVRPFASSTTAATVYAARRRPPPAWLPIRRLSPLHRPRILAHLLALDVRDRWLRFGFVAPDDLIARYVEQMSFERDEVLGIFDGRLQLVALAHLALPTTLAAESPKAPCAEFGVSVLARHRGRGMGQQLFNLAALHARNRGIDTLEMQAMAQNEPMLAIARRAGAEVSTLGNEATAVVRLPMQDPVSRLQQHCLDRLGEADYRVKRNRRRVRGLLTGWRAGPGSAAGKEGS